jgi:endonuclease YncB( thermonuclease family)
MVDQRLPRLRCLPARAVNVASGSSTCSTMKPAASAVRTTSWMSAFLLMPARSAQLDNRFQVMHFKRSVYGAIGALSLLWTPAAAQTITSGHTIKQAGINYRLWGIDAAEMKQSCPDWLAGLLATTRLLGLARGRQIVCQEKDLDRHGRAVAVCRISGEDLGTILVREGLAWAFVRYSMSARR